MALDFPSSPTVGQVYSGFTWDGTAWIQGGGTVIPQKKNYIINGAMMVSQENGATAFTGATSGYYPVDNFHMGGNNLSAGQYSLAQVVGYTPGGSPNRIRVTVTGVLSSPITNETTLLQTRVEGVKAVDLLYATANAKTLTLAFGVKAPAGTYAVTLRNGAGNRSYVQTFVIAAGEANTDVRKTVTFVGDTTGTWVTDNTTFMSIGWALVVGGTFATSTLGAWQAGTFLGATGQINLFATNGSVFELFDVSLTEGTVAPTFVVPDFASELAACMRYWQKFTAIITSGYGPATNNIFGDFALAVTMRIAPALTFANITYVNASALGQNAVYTNHIRTQVLITALGFGYGLGDISLNSRL